MSTLSSADLLLPVIPGSPREWEITDAALIEQANERLPDMPLLFTEAAWEARQRISSMRWCLVHNDHAARSEDTNRKEMYYTFLGVERPWNGLDEIGAWLFDELDPENANPTTAQMVNAILGQWLSIGRIEPISAERARQLSLEIFMRSRGRVDLWQQAVNGKAGR